MLSELRISKAGKRCSKCDNWLAEEEWEREEEERKGEKIFFLKQLLEK